MALFERLRLLGVASGALATGRCRAALEVLLDERLRGSDRAARLRVTALERLGLGADPVAWRAVTDADTKVLLERVRRFPPFVPAASAADAEPSAHGGAEPARPAASAPRQRAPAFLLCVDDAGVYLCAAGSELVLGHESGGLAELPFLADVASEHARLVFEAETFHAPAAWRLFAIAQRPVSVRAAVGGAAAGASGGAAPGSEGARLTAGDTVALGANLRFVLRTPDTASATVLLELLDEVECAGARRVLLVAPGPGGRFTIGGRSRNHVRAAIGEAQVALQLREGALVLECAAGLRPAGDPQAEPRERLVLELPLQERHDLVVGGPRPGEPPFGIALLPIDAD